MFKTTRKTAVEKEYFLIPAHKTKLNVFGF